MRNRFSFWILRGYYFKLRLNVMIFCNKNKFSPLVKMCRSFCLFSVFRYDCGDCALCSAETEGSSHWREEGWKSVLIDICVCERHTHAWWHSCSSWSNMTQDDFILPDVLPYKEEKLGVFFFVRLNCYMSELLERSERAALSQACVWLRVLKAALFMIAGRIVL